MHARKYSARSVTRDALLLKNERYTSTTRERCKRTGALLGEGGTPPPQPPVPGRPSPRMPNAALPYIFSPLEFFVDYLHV
ncbi:unnamed protein product [Arctia plantaginis]|uniref:Uncharacterized protein n=1 Tax=Arctia plantaginis TaxID=874455 RepID=A0A8S1B2J1_ARCPL|nr:unnamed protein product [Arctia plantaginis]CAB3253640.1 unnamed protein product [Arctia plantaginis]